MTQEWQKIEERTWWGPMCFWDCGVKIKKIELDVLLIDKSTTKEREAGLQRKEDRKSCLYTLHLPPQSPSNCWTTYAVAGLLSSLASCSAAVIGCVTHSYVASRTCWLKHMMHIISHNGLRLPQCHNKPLLLCPELHVLHVCVCSCCWQAHTRRHRPCTAPCLRLALCHVQLKVAAIHLKWSGH